MSCDSIQSRLQRFLDGKLGGAERAAIEDHLASCADCRELATLMNISKPAVTRAVDRLSELELVQRKTDENDRRSVLIQRTLKGRAFLTEFAGQVIVAGRQVA